MLPVLAVTKKKKANRYLPDKGHACTFKTDETVSPWAPDCRTVGGSDSAGYGYIRMSFQFSTFRQRSCSAAGKRIMSEVKKK